MKAKTKIRIISEVDGMVSEAWLLQYPNRTVLTAKQSVRAMDIYASQETAPLLAEISDLKENINRLIEAHVSAEEDFSRLKSNIKTVSDENITGVVDETFKGLGSLINDEDLFYFYKQLIITMYAGMVVDKNMEIHNLQAEIDRLKQKQYNWACHILKVRDALAENDQNEAFHWLYQIASPNFDKDSDEVWKEIEALATTPTTKVNEP